MLSLCEYLLEERELPRLSHVSRLGSDLGLVHVIFLLRFYYILKMFCGD